MAVSRVKGYGVTGFAATSASMTATTAAGTVGDVHVAGAQVFAQANTVTGPTGWTQIGAKHNATSQYQMTYWWWLDDGATTSFQWSWASTVDRGVWVEVFRGVHPTVPVLDQGFNQGTSATASNAGLTPAADGGFVLFVNNSNGFTTTSTPTGFTVRNNTLDQGVFSKEPVSAGAGTGALSATMSGGSTSWICDLIQLQVPPPPQVLLPDADLATTGWATAPLFSKVNDSSDATVVTGSLV